jgi:hypothetical protein
MTVCSSTAVHRHKVHNHIYMLVWSDRENRPGGPLRIREDEIRGTFTGPWRVEWIRRARFAIRESREGAKAWFARVHYQGIPA